MRSTSTTVASELLGRGDPATVALVDADGCSITREALVERVAARRDDLALGRRGVVVLTGSTSVELVVSYLALLDAGHVPLLAGAHVDRLVGAWQPDAIVDVHGAEVHVERRHAPDRELHPDLALLLSTSGTTGSPKLVRLSHDNLLSNALAIAELLRLEPGDRGITTLPLHYCYGLSVLHSHLAAGASVVVTEASVVDPCFAAAMRYHGVTNVAGVPHTYELLERAGPERLRVPSLRFVTQAGGRMAPEAVERWLRRSHDWGIDFVVMYGQTEATARMAYLPPAVARRRPGAIGVPIPGGELELRHVDGAPAGAGELVYRGPNVMLGYATEPGDLAAGATLTELCTGDLGRFHADDGVFEIVGRRSRFVKPFGLRVDLDGVERELRATWADIAVAGDDEHIAVAAPGADAAAVRAAVVALTDLPASIVAVDTVSALPRTTSGKVDYASVLAASTATPSPGAGGPREWDRRPGRGGRPASSVADVYRVVLGARDVAPSSTFVSLGGDSLSYVECSVHVERLLGHLPDGWHLRTVADLEASTTTPRRTPRLDTTVLARAVGICAVVATHMHLAFVPGGAHLLLAVAGFNLSRFQLPIEATADRVRAGLRTAARAAVPTVLWTGAGLAVGASYGVGTLLLVNNYTGPRSHTGDHWHFWFIEVFVHLTVLTTLLLAVPAVRRLDRRFPFGLPLGLLVASIALRMEWAQLDDWYNLRYRTHGVAWFFVLGWLVHRSTTVPKRLVTSAVCLVTVPGFFAYPQREWFIAAGLVLLVWCRDVPWPQFARRAVTTLAAASMWILLTHFTVWPPLDDVFVREVAYVLTIGAGIGAWAVAERAGRALRAGVVDRRARDDRHDVTPAHGPSALVAATAAP